MKIIKPLDIVIIFSLFVISVLPIFFYSSYNGSLDGGKKEFYLLVDDKVIYLDKKNVILDLNKYGKNVKIEILEEKLRFIESDCRDKICIKTGFISKCNDVAICIPNKVALQIKCQKSDFDAISQ
ncbi:MAG: NusG domain II-containing protein [Deferribacterales bacterium]|nr:NusG domain II-containing protein [Deferribacterales bacterium]